MLIYTRKGPLLLLFLLLVSQQEALQCTGFAFLDRALFTRRTRLIALRRPSSPAADAPTRVLPLQPNSAKRIRQQQQQLWLSSPDSTPENEPVSSSSSSHKFLDDTLNSVARHFQSLDSAQAIHKDLVKRAVAFSQLDSDDSSAAQQSAQSTLMISPIHKVPGCVANVHVRTVLTPAIITSSGNAKQQQQQYEMQEDTSRSENSVHSSRSDDFDLATDYTVRVEGTADALVSRGLLATMAALLVPSSSKDSSASYIISAHDVLQLAPETFSHQLGLSQALSPGRNDGMASLLRTVQLQIRHLLVQLENDTQQQQESATINGVAPNGSSKASEKQQQVVHTETDATTSSSSPGKQPSQPSVALLLSGGVDSSVALHLLLRAGYNVTAFYLKIWLEDELAHLGQCPWEDDYRMCQAVCEQASNVHGTVPLESISLQQAYQERVISYTVNEAQQGRTPNPDIMCNSRVKFGCFYDAIADRDFDYVATGHYAQLVRHDKNADQERQPVRLVRAPDPVKDQSYFLCALTQDQLQRVLFPIGHLQKAAVRQLADDFGLPNRHRPDSQGLCFLGQVKFDEFLAAYLGERPGDIVDAATGELLGQHRGCWFHTVGQRRGIGKVLDPLATSRGPWYVVAKDPARNTVFCSNQYDQELFTAARSEFAVENIHWIAGHRPSIASLGASNTNNGSDNQEQSYQLTMKVRHGPKLVNGTLTLSDGGEENGDIKLQHKDSGLAPGQYVAFYNGEECLGGGVISERHWAKFLLDRETHASAAAGALQ